MNEHIAEGAAACGWRGLRRGVLCLAALLVLPSLFVGCNTQGCADTHSALPLAAFYSSSTKAHMMLDSIDLGGVGAPGDSLLVRSGESVTSLYLPFRSDAGSTSFFIHYDYKEQGLDNPEFDDVITFHYTSEPYFASEECGAYYIYHIRKLEYTTHLIDSVVIADSVITNVDLERILIYIRTAGSETTPEEASSRPVGALKHIVP